MDEELEVTPAEQEVRPGSPEYDEMMADKFRASKSTQEPTDDNRQTFTHKKPDDVPEKFWDAEKGQVRVEEMLKSLSHLESQLTKTRQGKDTAETKIEESTTTAEAAVESAGLDWDTLRQKVVQDGAIEEGDYAALEEAGIPREIVDDYIDGLRYRAEAEASAALEYVGGKESMDKLLGWAKDNLSLQEKQRYNALLASSEWRVALDVLSTKMQSAQPTSGEPKLVAGNGFGSSVTGYQTVAEMKADMADPRYQSDPGFREEVAQKMAFATWKYDR